MNKYYSFYLMALIMAIFFTQGCKPNDEQAANYLSALSNPIESMIHIDTKMQMSLIASLEEVDSNGNLVDSSGRIYDTQTNQFFAFTNDLNAFKIQSLGLIDTLNKVAVYNDEIALKKLALTVAETFNKVANQELSKIDSLLHIPQERYTESDDQLLNELLNNYNVNLNVAIEAFHAEVTAFAKRNKLDVEVEE